jgi:hypothetical protein
MFIRSVGSSARLRLHTEAAPTRARLSPLHNHNLTAVLLLPEGSLLASAPEEEPPAAEEATRPPVSGGVGGGDVHLVLDDGLQVPTAVQGQGGQANARGNSTPLI